MEPLPPEIVTASIVVIVICLVMMWAISAQHQAQLELEEEQRGHRIRCCLATVLLFLILCPATYFAFLYVRARMQPPTPLSVYLAQALPVVIVFLLAFVFFRVLFSRPHLQRKKEDDVDSEVEEVKDDVENDDEHADKVSEITSSTETTYTGSEGQKVTKRTTCKFETFSKQPPPPTAVPCRPVSGMNSPRQNEGFRRRQMLWMPKRSVTGPVPVYVVPANSSPTPVPRQQPQHPPPKVIHQTQVSPLPTPPVYAPEAAQSAPFLCTDICVCQQVALPPTQSIPQQPVPAQLQFTGPCEFRVEGQISLIPVGAQEENLPHSLSLIKKSDSRSSSKESEKRAQKSREKNSKKSRKESKKHDSKVKKEVNSKIKELYERPSDDPDGEAKPGKGMYQEMDATFPSPQHLSLEQTASPEFTGANYNLEAGYPLAYTCECPCSCHEGHKLAFQNGARNET